jgi:hypothetical protein
MMSKKILIEIDEVMRILSLHEQEKKKIQEQVAPAAVTVPENTTPAPNTQTTNTPTTGKKTRQDLIAFYTKAKTDGCITDGNLDLNNFFRVQGNDRAYVKGPSASMKGMVKRVYDDFSWEVVDPTTGKALKSGKWTCKSLEPAAPVTPGVNPNAGDIQQEIAAGWKERKDLANVSNDELAQLYIKHPKYDLYKLKGGDQGKQGGYTPQQQAWIDTWTQTTDPVTGQKNADVYRINLTNEETASQAYVPVIAPGSEKVFPNGGLTVYYNPNKVSTVTGSVINTILANQTTDREACRKNVLDYYTAYSRRNSVNIPPKEFDEAKRIVQGCADTYYRNWGLIGSLKKGEGNRTLDNYIDILRGGAGGPSPYGQDAKWKLK